MWLHLRLDNLAIYSICVRKRFHICLLYQSHYQMVLNNVDITLTPTGFFSLFECCTIPTQFWKRSRDPDDKIIIIIKYDEQLLQMNGSSFAVARVTRK